MKGRRRVAKPRRQMRRRALPKRYLDVHSFKLTGKETTIYTTNTDPPNVATSGPGVGISNLSIFPNGVARFGGVYIGSIASTTQWTQLSTLFDRYKIHGIKLTFIPEWNQSPAGQVVAAPVNLPVMKIVHDYDDSSVPTVGDVWARQGKIYRLTRPFSVFYRPKVANTVYNGIATSAFSVLKAPYLNSSYANVPHYGLKFAIKDWTATSGMCLRIETTYYVSVREQINVGAVGHTGEEEAAPFEENAEQQEDVACELKP